MTVAAETLMEQHRRRHRAAEVRRVAWTALKYVVLTAIGFVFLFPFLWSIAASLKTLNGVYEFPPTLLVRNPQWRNYVEAMSILPFPVFIWNSLIVCTLTVIGQVLSASLVAYAFARLSWRGRRFWFIVVLATLMLPVQLMVIPQYLVFQRLGWVNTFKPLIVPAWFGGGAFAIFLLRQFFMSIPRDLEDAARLDGATDLEVWWHVILPLSKPALVTVAVLSFIARWKMFFGPLVYLSSPEKYTTALGLAMFQSIHGSFANLLMAASVITAVPLVILFFAAQRLLVRGILLTGMKG
ncbi:MAG TPA: carbohydrate ABC transporter permease [Phycisphaerae bacterium]|nr:carbohydrate ABC transporter permease [Phycisphaerae bacterium]